MVSRFRFWLRKKFSVSDSNSELNLSILQVSFNISDGNGDGAMALLFKTALEGINDSLKAEFGDNAIQKLMNKVLMYRPKQLPNALCK